MSVKKRSFTAQFKSEAVKLAESVGICKAAKDLGVATSCISRWKAASRTQKTPSANPPKPPKRPTRRERDVAQQREISRLKKELGYVYKINEVLKKSLGILATDRKTFSG